MRNTGERGLAGDLFFPNIKSPLFAGIVYVRNGFGRIERRGMDLKKVVQAILVAVMGVFLCMAGKKQAHPLEPDAGADEPVTITWFVAEEGYAKTWNPWKNLADAKILRNTGVNLEVKSGDLTDLDALIATDSLPDLITVEAETAERYMLENSGMAEPLEPLFETYAPDVNIPDSMKEWYRNADGNWYSIASYYYGKERVNEEFGGYLGTHNNNYVRTDLLEQTGISMEELKSKEGLLLALRAAKGLTYKNQDVIPYSGWWTQNLAEQFGMKTEDEEGNYLSKYRQPEWLEALQFGNQMYREGLMLPEEFTESLSQRRKQVQSGRIFFCTGYSNVQDAKDILYSNDKHAQMMYVGQVRGDRQNMPNLKSVSSGGWTVTMVHRGAKHKREIAKFISYMTQEEATLDAAPSVGTETYDIVDGHYVIRDSVKQEFEENYQRAAEKYFPNLEFFVDWTIVQKYQPPSEAQAFKEQYRGCSIYDSKAADAAVSVGTDRQMQELKEKIENYYRGAEIQVLTAGSREECTLEYQEAIAHMEKLGLKDLESFERKRYQEAKKKLNQ